MRWISFSFGLASISAASMLPRRKIRISASLPLRRSSFADIGMSDTPSASCRPLPSANTRAGSIVLGHEELARPGLGDLAGAGNRVAGEANDVIVVENGNLRGHAGIFTVGRAAEHSISSALKFSGHSALLPRRRPAKSRHNSRKRPCPITLADLRRDLADAYRIVANEGILDAFGHISVRHPGNPNRYFLSRSRAPGLVQAGRHPRIRSRLQPDRAADRRGPIRSA